MEALRLGGRIRGPQTFVHLCNEDVHVWLFGEEHSNKKQCLDGYDVVDLVRKLAVDGIDIYLEMPTGYKSQVDVNQMVCNKSSSSRPRKAVLNELRTCMYILKHKHAHRNIHFVDPREKFGPLTFSAEEDDFVAKSIQRPDIEGLTIRFIDPIIAAEQKICPMLSDELRDTWHALVYSKLDILNCAIQRKSVRFALKLFHAASDNIMNIYAIHLIQRQIEAGHKTHVLYSGAAHVFDIKDILVEKGYVIADQYKGDPAVSCVVVKSESDIASK